MPKEHESLKRRLIIGRKNQDTMTSCRASESEVERPERLREADCRASESDAECAKHLGANQQREADHRV